MTIFKYSQRRTDLQRKRASVMQGTFTLGEHASEFADEALDLVDRSNAATLERRLKCPVSRPPHGSNRRAVHPHGVIIDAEFRSTGDAAAFTVAPQLQPAADVRAQVRVSNFLLDLDEPDIMGLAVKLEANGTVWDLVGTSTRRFIAGRIAAFRAISEVPTLSRSSRRHAELFVTAVLNGISLKALGSLGRAQASWNPFRKERDAATYWGVHTFFLSNGSQLRPFKYRWQPDRDQPGRFNLYLDLLDPEWKHLNSATKTPSKRHKIDAPIHAGTLHFDLPGSLPSGSGQASTERDLLFLPTRVPPGIGLSDDEILFARGGAYQLSYLRRSQPQPPSIDEPSGDVNHDRTAALS